MANRTPAETYKNIAGYFSTINTGLMMIGAAAQTARILADNLDDEDEKHVAVTLAESLDLLGDHFRTMLDFMRESIVELRTAGTGDGTGRLG